jgi:iron(III) transport system substrate-binding protein
LLLAACAPGSDAPAPVAAPATAAPVGTAGAAASPDPEADPEPEPGAEEGELVVYSGRSEDLVGSLVEQFERELGIEVAMRYGDTAELAATILEEGENSPADLFWAQDAGALGALSKAGRLQVLDKAVLDPVDSAFRSPDGHWVGLSGRARTVVYNTERLTPDELPDSILGFTDPAWRGRIGWAPANGSFQSFVTALRALEGEEAARAWLEGMLANEPQVFEGNAPIVEAVASGEIDVGLVNHYYLYRFLGERGESFAARNHHFAGQDAGNLVNVAGAGILDTAAHRGAAEAFLAFLLSEPAQAYFAREAVEYPLAAGVAADPRLPPLDDIAAPDIDLSDLEDLEGTLELLAELGIL